MRSDALTRFDRVHTDFLLLIHTNYRQTYTLVFEKAARETLRLQFRTPPVLQITSCPHWGCYRRNPI